MESVFIYWDNSNFLIETQRLAEEREEEPTQEIPWENKAKDVN